ncbi:MAG: hypothetical protein AB7P20_16245 [Rhizobiaceae bacterium]
MASNQLTIASFANYRREFGPQDMNVNAARYDGDIDQMTAEDGLESWIDGPIKERQAKPQQLPDLEAMLANKRLWVVTTDDVLHAREKCLFGEQREAKAAKHSNLTAGNSAFAGGEVVFADRQTIAITGSSGRYRLRSAEELKAIEVAFAESGYNVWSMGFNQDTNRPNVFEGNTEPEWVSI